MVNWITIGIVAGLAGAALHAAILQPSAVTALLFYISPLPIFLAGFGWGLKAAALGGLAGTIALVATIGVLPASTFAAGAVAVPLLLCWLALKSRPAGDAAEGEAQANGVQWYPEGRLVLWAAACAGALTALAVLLVAPDADSFRADIEAALRSMLTIMSEGMPAAEVERMQSMVGVLAAVLPLAMASFWLLATLLNLKLATSLLRIANLGMRPWARFGRLAFPRTAAFALPLAIVASFLPGMAGFAGSLFASAFFTAFALLGLAVLHGLTEGMPARTPLLAGLYVAVLFLNWILVVPFAALGLIEMAFGMRARGAVPPANPT